MKPKKTIHQLRAELLLAYDSAHISNLIVASDYVCFRIVMPKLNSAPATPLYVMYQKLKKLNQLKKYIEHAFDDVHDVNIFAADGICEVIHHTTAGDSLCPVTEDRFYMPPKKKTNNAVSKKHD